MKQRLRWLLATLALLLAACGGGGIDSVASGGGGGGGGGVGSGGTGIVRTASIGPITGFGSIFVNGIEFETGGALLALEDAGSLQLGMVVEVQGEVDTARGTGTATSVASAADLRGAIAAIDGGAGTLTVFGITARVDEATVFDGVSGLAGLVVGDLVQLYGLPDAAGGIRATRVEKLGAATPILSGPIAGLDTSASTFQLGGLTVRYTSATFGGGLSASGLRNGLTVRVRAATAPVAGVLDASRIQPWYAVAATEGTAATLSAVVSDYVSLASFKLLGQPVDASKAQITGGPASSIGNGVTVEVSGSFSQGVLVATTLKIRHVPGTGGPVSFQIDGTVGAYVSPASFRVQGNPVDASGTDVVFSGGTASDLRNGAKVLVTGSQVTNGVLKAETVTFKP